MIHGLVSAFFRVVKEKGIMFWLTLIYIYIYMRGGFNEFPDFFVWAFKIVVDT